MYFSHRTSWQRQPNRLTTLFELRKRQGLPILDLTQTNPTECGFIYPSEKILSALSQPQSLFYNPDPDGLLSARECVAAYYRKKKLEVKPSNIFLTASTSEAYSFIFKCLCNAGDNVLVPKPSYPLFEYLAQVNDIHLQFYDLCYDHGWHVDTESLRQCSLDSLKAIICIHPHNPTGMFLKQHEYDAIKEFARNCNAALVVDEVFNEYIFDPETNIISTAAEPDVLTFTLNGISKMCGLPQMKLGWIIASGKPELVNESMERLEIISDIFLSVNTPAQIALPAFMEIGSSIQRQIRERLTCNLDSLTSQLTQLNFIEGTNVSHLVAEGGWYSILRVPAIKTDEEWAIELLDRRGVYVHPGYFFDFENEGYLVISLLVKEDEFQAGVREIIRYVEECC